MSYCRIDDCARVAYQEYLPAVVRWRYPEEDWQEIQGADNYSIESVPPAFLGGQCPGTAYYCTIEFFNNHEGRWKVASTNSGFNLVMYQPVTGYEFELLGGGYNPPRYYILGVGASQTGAIVKHYFRFNGTSQITLNGQGNLTRTANALRNFKVIFQSNNQEDTGTCGNPPDKCTFTIVNKGQIVHTETRNICPEVEKLSARLSPIQKQFEVKKQFDLETIEINQNSIPANCWNIYLKSGDSSTFVSQICSSAGNLPPVYQVICGCDRPESCPPNTCPVKCGNKVCCYGTNGVSVKSIDLSSYG